MNALCDRDRFLFQRRPAVAGRRAFEKILAQESHDPAHSFVLRGVNQFVQEQMSILPAIGPNEDAVSQSEPARFHGQKINCIVRGL